MQVRNSQEVGCIKIYTPDYLDPSFSPKKHPHIVFVFRFSGTADTKYFSKLGELGLLSQGIHKESNGQFVLTVTSTRKVIHAIDLFSSLPEYHIDENQELFVYLNQYKQKLIAIENAKPPKSVPTLSQPYSNFKVLDQIKLQQSTNETEIILNESTNEKYVHKKNLSGRSISEIEAFNGLCYRLLLGHRHPKTFSTHGNKGERVGVASQLIPGFTTLHEFSIQTKITESKIISSHMIMVWIASYIEEEFDLHINNYGLNEEGCFKIDDDRSGWVLTCKYFGIDPELDINLTNFNYHVPPVDTFQPSNIEILEFPNLVKSNPFHWINKEDHLKIFSHINFDKLAKNEKLISDKFYMLLKRILIRDHVYEKMGEATISSEKTRAKWVAYKSKKTKNFKDILLSMPEFIYYVSDNPLIINKIRSEFSKFNTDYSHLNLKVDLEEISSEFEILNNQIKSKYKDIMSDIAEIAHFIEYMSDLFNGILNHAQDFHGWCIEKLNLDLTRDMYYYFKEAIQGEYMKNNGLKHGNPQLMIKLLKTNHALVKAFKIHLDTYHEKPWENISHDKLTSYSLSQPNPGHATIKHKKMSSEPHSLKPQKSKNDPTFFSTEIVVKDKIEIDKILNNVNSVKFFILLILCRDSKFKDWASNNLDMIVPLDQKINSCFQVHNTRKILGKFKSAITSDVMNENLTNANKEHFELLLEANPAFLDVIKANIEHPIIEKWYENYRNINTTKPLAS